MTKLNASFNKSFDSENTEYFYLIGNAYYPHLHRPHKAAETDKLKYSLDLTVDKKTAKFLEELGVPIKNRATGKNVLKKDETDTKGDYVTLKRSAEYIKDGELVKLSAPKVIDAKTNTIPESILIGNGSLVKVKASIYKYTKPKKGVGLGFIAVQVLDLVPFEAKNSSILEGFDAEEGYTIDTNDSTSNLENSLDNLEDSNYDIEF